MIRRHARIVDCSPPRDVTLKTGNAVAGELVETRAVTVVSFQMVFPAVAPGQVISIWAADTRLDIDGRGIYREPFRSRWGPVYEGFIVENFVLTAFGERMPEIVGYVVGDGMKASPR